MIKQQCCKSVRNFLQHDKELISRINNVTGNISSVPICRNMGQLVMVILNFGVSKMGWLVFNISNNKTLTVSDGNSKIKSTPFNIFLSFFPPLNSLSKSHFRMFRLTSHSTPLHDTSAEPHHVTYITVDMRERLSLHHHTNQHLTGNHLTGRQAHITASANEPTLQIPLMIKYSCWPNTKPNWMAFSLTWASDSAMYEHLRLKEFARIEATFTPWSISAWKQWCRRCLGGKGEVKTQTANKGQNWQEKGT